MNPSNQLLFTYFTCVNLIDGLTRISWKCILCQPEHVSWMSAMVSDIGAFPFISVNYDFQL